MAREHNNANVLCIGARVLSIKQALKITQAFIKTNASKEKRHERRIKKMMQAECKHH
jgi:ribose 5-phosphate isomerase RpiB